ncbi:MAG: hypothetical protein K6F49_01625 [Saccharofermentans sp.]|nr:hypothetical protein [Saccharofermentans sp.]
MDYLEGLFLGKLWSDTDFENRRHLGLFTLYGFLVALIFSYRYLTGRPLFFIGGFGTIQLVLLIILFLACPFICFRYYRMPFWGKLLVIFEKIAKAVLVIDLTVELAIPRVKVQVGGLQDYLIGYLNSTLETYTEKFASEAGSFATVMGVLMGGIHTVLVFVGIIALAVIVPGLVFLLIRYVQFGYDWVIDKLILKKYFRFRR